MGSKQWQFSEGIRLCGLYATFSPLLLLSRYYLSFSLTGKVAYGYGLLIWRVCLSA
jgi:hypothetical protein